MWQAAIGRLRAILKAAAVHEADEELLQSTMDVLKLYLCFIMCNPASAKHLALHSMVDGATVDRQTDSYTPILVVSTH